MGDGRILCIIHCYYPQFIAELAECVANISEPHDTIVTYSTASAFEEARRCFPEARFIECENVGFDVWPFLKTLQTVRLEDYGYILKLHTKCDRPTNAVFKINRRDFTGPHWRRYLLSFVRTKEAWEASMERLKNDPSVSMVGGLECIIRREDTPWRPDQAGFDTALEMAKELGISPDDPQFVAGTMFVARSKVFARLAGVFSAADFKCDNVHTTTTKAHYLERIIGFAACCGGCRISDPYGRLEHWRKRVKVARVLDRIGGFVFKTKRTADGGTIAKLFKIPVYKKPGPRPPERTDSSNCVFVTVVRDHEMYARLIRNNAANAGAEFVAFDNLAENMSITRRYNSFLDGWDYSRKAWFVFLHEDYEFLEPVGPLLDRVDPRCIYGTVGARSTQPGDDAVWAVNSNRDGSDLSLYGRPISKPVDVLTSDCNCMMVHSDLVRDFHLRFDENLTFDLYTEDFEISAFERYGIRTKVLGAANHHYSFGNICRRFFVQRRYLLEKYSSAKRVYGTTTKQLIGPMPLVLAARRRNRLRRRTAWLRKIGRFFWYVKYSRDFHLRIRAFGIRLKFKIEYPGLNRK